MNPQTQQLIGRAIEHFQNGSPQQAEEILVRILNVESNNLPALEILGLIKAMQGNHLESVKLLKKAVKLNSQNPATQYNLAKALSEGRDYVGSLIHHEKALQLAPNNPDGWLNYGQTLANLKRHEQALTAFNNALSINPNYIEAWYNKALGCEQLKQHEEAINCFRKVIEIQPNHVKAWLDMSTSLGMLQHYEDAIGCCEKALALQPNLPEAWLNKGSAYSELKQFTQAVDCYQQALGLKPNYADAWYSKGIALEKLDQHQEALICYDKAIEINPNHARAWLNRGNCLGSLKLYEGAIDCCNQALKLQAHFPEAWLNKGSAYNELAKYDMALSCYQKALELNPDYVDAWYSKGVMNETLCLYSNAMECYEKAITLNPHHSKAWLNKGEVYAKIGKNEDALASYELAFSMDCTVNFLQGVILHTKALLANWNNRGPELSFLIGELNLDKKVTPPLGLLAFTDSPDIHLKAAKIWVDTKYPINTSLGKIPKNPSHQKIKIAYFSADFKEHPVSYLTAELFELHNRERFEVYAFSLRKAEQSPIRERLLATFDHFIEVDAKSDQEVALLARELEIDIAIDLGGHTQHARTGIFAHRAAPIQINYLGFAGTMGTSFMDYIVVDKVVIPDEYKEYYLEKKVYLPNSYMVDDSRRLPSNKVFKRADFGLPEEGLVFCCFNNSYKFNPARIASFATILTRVPNSVLWVTGNNESFRKNLVAEFDKLGITKERIIFSGIVDAIEDHLARYRLADLFLDTSPYNAHTTAMDSLKAGVPILTLAGKSFASRVGASLLTAVGLPELITHNEQSFVDLAVKLGENSHELQSIKEKLANNLLSTPLFNTKLFCKHLEVAYQEMYRNHLQDLPPADIYVPQSS